VPPARFNRTETFPPRLGESVQSDWTTFVRSDNAICPNGRIGPPPGRAEAGGPQNGTQLGRCCRRQFFSVSLFALKGRDVVAQGNALGLGHQWFPRALKGRNKPAFVAPLQGFKQAIVLVHFPGRCPGL
jgi:hypothetical protein